MAAGFARSVADRNQSCAGSGKRKFRNSPLISRQFQRMATPAKHVESPIEVQPSRRPRRLLHLWVLLALVLVFLAANLYLRSASFRERVREKVVAELEHVTGGKVVLESFRWNLAKLKFEATN